VRISRELLEEIAAHAREEAPNECCGMVAGRDGTAVRVARARSRDPSPLRYEVEPGDLHRIVTEIEDGGEELAAIYHSHVRSEPYPSQTDVNLAIDHRGEQLWPGTLYLIFGLREQEARLWDIRPGGEVVEVALEVDGDGR